MNNFNWQSFLRDNSELFKYKQKVKFPASDYDIDKEAADLDVKEITQICNHALVDFLKKQTKTGDVGTFNSATGTGNDINSDISICDFAILKRIDIKINSLKYLQSLKICNNPELKSIKTEDGDWNENRSLITGICYNIKRCERRRENHGEKRRKS